MFVDEAAKFNDTMRELVRPALGSDPLKRAETLAE